MRYIICGLHRTGTSALMKAVIDSSSLTPYVDPKVEAVIRSREADQSYDPNPEGYFSHGSMFSPIADWISNTPDNSVMKAAPEAFAVGAGTEPLSVILTSRPQTEIEASFAQAFGMDVPEYRYTARTIAEQILTYANNITLTIISFSQLLSDPLYVFTNFVAYDGWPIDPDVAASTIDPNLKRF
jgi:hypothetical protein